MFNSSICKVKKSENKQTIFTKRNGSTYIANLNKQPSNDAWCLLSKEDESWLWHRRIVYIHMDCLINLICKELVKVYQN